MFNKTFLTGMAGKLKTPRFKLTRKRLLWFALTLIVFGIALGGLDTNTRGEATASKVVDVGLPGRHLPPPARVEPAKPAAENRDEAWDEVSVRPGQSLDAIFHQQGFSAATLHGILALNADTKRLKDIRPGDVFEFRRAADGSLKSMRYAIDEGRYLLVSNSGGRLSAQTQARDVYTQTEEAVGTIQSSLFLAGKQAGLTDAMVMKLANLFGWDIDFVLDIRAGDRFYVVYEKVFRDGSFLRDGEIVAATFINQGERFQAIRYKIDGKARYFSPDGRTIRKAFLRAPLNFSYISSNFNPRRFHPILKRIKPHNGIDYRAPRGTPVYAAGDGKVIRSAYNKYNGNYVFIQHSNSIVTKYLHFTKRAVKRGQRVRQGQVIGYVGSTGLAQAPHLHYEFVVNGVHRNPRTVPLPKAEGLKGQQLADFKKSSAVMLTQLARLESASMYAASQ
jgi:murein DD-endopeptidase MepM/ murein hydrolase activator NlpD